ncbi:hypothetical protein SHM_08340 [Spiroplasma ixodetis]|uniref:Uncharacterized protein n=1 Tax=Spiroplasma ixodetis TaxID=2141 RepID=A0ABM8BU09_9MOLU|nr:hypothetical protein SHM_08340 [Spiroplasma ixodetis]
MIRINQLIIDDYKNKLSLLVKERENNDWETINLEDIDKPSTSQNKWRGFLIICVSLFYKVTNLD